jgi:hypothetical protein
LHDEKGSRADNWKPMEERILIEILTIRTNGSIQSFNDTVWLKNLAYMNSTRLCDMNYAKKKKNGKQYKEIEKTSPN